VTIFYCSFLFFSVFSPPNVPSFPFRIRNPHADLNTPKNGRLCPRYV
jgi:hypothetical protein